MKKGKSVFDGSDLEEMAQTIKAIAHPTRLRILFVLKRERRCVGDFAKTLGIKQANVSQHLAILRNRSIIRASRDGKRVCYILDDPKILELLDVLGDPEVPVF